MIYFTDEKIEAQKSCHLSDSNLLPESLSLFPAFFPFTTASDIISFICLSSVSPH